MGNGGSSLNSTAVGIAVGFGILAILFTIAIVQFCCKHKCKKCCKKKKPSLKDKVLTKVSLKKSPPPFSISSYTKWQLTRWQLILAITMEGTPLVCHFPTHYLVFSLYVIWSCFYFAVIIHVTVLTWILRREVNVMIWCFFVLFLHYF